MFKKYFHDTYHRSDSCSVPSDSLRPHGLYSAWRILQARILELVAYPFFSGSSNPGSKPGSSALQVDSLPTELSGKPQFIQTQNKDNNNPCLTEPVREVNKTMLIMNLGES